MKKFKVLVFPCGSECGLEIGRSLSGLKEVELWGASSVADHGQMCFDRYVGGLPFIDSEDFVSELNAVLVEHGIDFVYPAMDLVIDVLAKNEDQLEADLIGSPCETTSIALSKLRTYELLKSAVRCPRIYSIESLKPVDFPLFVKPEIGYGSRGAKIVRSKEEVEHALAIDPSLLVLEYFPGDEYTVDCFTDFNGELIFSGGRIRQRVRNGISVNTRNVPEYASDFKEIAEAINQKVSFNGAWFYQVKKTKDGNFGLLEIAPRVAGSMGLHRCKGINLPLMSVFNQAKISVASLENNYDIEFDRALYNKVSISSVVDNLYLDFDDCILIDELYLNADIIKLAVQSRNKNVKVAIVSRHEGDLNAKLKDLGIAGLFDEVHHLRNGEPKTAFMNPANSFLIDDSFRERLAAAEAGIPSLGPESVETLLS